MLGTGEQITINDQLMRIDGSLLHSSTEFVGERWSIVCFAHSAFFKAGAGMMAQLTALPLKLPPPPRCPLAGSSPTPELTGSTNTALMADEADTSSAEESGEKRWKAGSGWVGHGQAIRCRRKGKWRPFQDGAGFVFTGQMASQQAATAHRCEDARTVRAQDGVATGPQGKRKSCPSRPTTTSQRENTRRH